MIVQVKLCRALQETGSVLALCPALLRAVMVVQVKQARRVGQAAHHRLQGHHNVLAHMFRKRFDFHCTPTTLAVLVDYFQIHLYLEGKAVLIKLSGGKGSLHV
jgi:hypothetical protein